MKLFALCAASALSALLIVISTTAVGQVNESQKSAPSLPTGAFATIPTHPFIPASYIEIRPSKERYVFLNDCGMGLFFPVYMQTNSGCDAWKKGLALDLHTYGVHRGYEERSI